MQLKLHNYINIQYTVPFSCLSARAYVHKNTVDANLLKIHKEMSDSLDTQVYMYACMYVL